jgi:hypothetical protein
MQHCTADYYYYYYYYYYYELCPFPISRSYTYSVGPPCIEDEPVARPLEETEAYIHASGGNRTYYPVFEQAKTFHTVSPRVQCDRHRIHHSPCSEGFESQRSINFMKSGHEIGSPI